MYRPAERRALIVHGVRAFCLTSGNLDAQAMTDCFVRDQHRIWTEAARTGPALFAVSRHDIGEIRSAAADLMTLCGLGAHSSYSNALTSAYSSDQR
jgi:hypothetical protein